jgi:hypothetical protein
MSDIQMKHVRFHLRTSTVVNSTGKGFHSKNRHIQLYLSKKFLLHSKPANGSHIFFHYTVVDMKETRQLYDTEFGHFTKQLVNLHCYLLFSIITYLYIEFGHFTKQLDNFQYYVTIGDTR